MTGENGEQVLMTTGEVLESFSEGGEESVLGYQEAEDTGQPGQDLVSLAMETSKVTGLAAAEETKEEGPPQDQEAADTEDYPDEIECQLVQKSVFLDGEVKTIDFIMCNQCPRLFRSENLLWNHIKAKHKRRTYRRLPLTSHALDRNYSSVVGLEKSGNKLGRPPGAVTSPEKFLRQKARKRIYVDSNHGPFKCPGCDNVTFSNRRSLDMHMKRLHKAGIVECDECGRKVLDLKRHKEILHKRFKIFDCPHCNDKFCTQEDLERHLAKIEKNNIVEGSPATQIKAVRQKTKPVKEPEVEKSQETEKEKEKEKEEKIGIEENIEPVDTMEIVKELEAKTYSCSECGLKTHSRMPYIQHVLNGCIMDMVLGEVDNDSPAAESPGRGRTPAKRGRKPGFKPSSDGASRKRQRADE